MRPGRNPGSFLYFYTVNASFPHYSTTFPLSFLIALCQYIDMVCIYCGSDTKVTNSRHQKRLNHVWRRRKCIFCKAVFTTTETADSVSALRINFNGRMEPFLRDNLLISVYDSLKHRKSALTDATGLTATIVSNVYDLTDNGVVDREAVVTVTLAILERFDPVAATHYRAFHPLR